MKTKKNYNKKIKTKPQKSAQKLRKSKNRNTKNKTMKLKKPKRNQKKQLKKARAKVKTMKGGAIPFSELNPMVAIDNMKYGAAELLRGAMDYPQPAPNNLDHNVNPNVVSQPYMENSQVGQSVVVGTDPENLFEYTQ